jgi:hypothetical protein
VASLSEEDKKALLRIARESIAARLDGRSYDPPEPTSPALSERAGAFVSLHKGPDLRGCIESVPVIGQLPTKLRGVELQFGSTLAPIFSVCNLNGQESVTFQAPFDLQSGFPVTLIARVGTGSTTINNVQVRDYQPGTFETADAQGRRYVVAIRPDAVQEHAGVPDGGVFGMSFTPLVLNDQMKVLVGVLRGDVAHVLRAAADHAVLNAEDMLRIFAARLLQPRRESVEILPIKWSNDFARGDRAGGRFCRLTDWNKNSREEKAGEQMSCWHVVAPH